MFMLAVILFRANSHVLVKLLVLEDGHALSLASSLVEPGTNTEVKLTY
jgi:hypothetical protein